MRNILLIFAFVLPLSVWAQGNKYEDVVPMTLQRTIRVKAAGVEQTFAVDPMKTTSTTRDGAMLERLEISPNHFVPSLKTTKGDVPEGVAAVLGRDAFARVVLTIMKDQIVLSSPYKPEWMPLKSRADLAALRIDSLSDKGVVSLDFARGKYYFLCSEDIMGAVEKDVETAAEATPEGEIEHLTTLDFLKKVADIRNGEEWKFLGDKPCVLDFWAEWCAPCKRMNPGVEALAKEYAGLVRVYKINIDEEPELKEYFKAVAIPMFVFIPRVGAPKAVMGSSIDVVHAEMEALLR